MGREVLHARPGVPVRIGVRVTYAAPALVFDELRIKIFRVILDISSSDDRTNLDFEVLRSSGSVTGR